jgi:transcriptional regulator with XRE-family HTH domain
MTSEEICAAIKKKRKSLSFTQAQLAESTGLSAYYIGLLESGQKSPTLRTLELVCEALGLEVSVGAKHKKLKAAQQQ